MLQFSLKNNFSGVLYVTKDSECILQKAFGYAEKGLKVKNFILTRFAIASGGKIFTSIGILKLVEQGKINLNDEIIKYIPELPENYRNITIENLLTHTSGIGDYFDETVKDSFTTLWDKVPMYKMQTPNDFYPFIIEKNIIREPGIKFEYNNSAYILLGLLIEKVSGLSYIQYIEKTIFNPCKMSDSGFFKMNELPPRTAYGYVRQDDGGFRNNIYDLPIIGGADGGVYVTAIDMAKFWNELISYELLSEDLTKSLLSIKSETDRQNIAYGYGVWIEHRDYKIDKVYLMGYDPGINFRLEYFPDTKILMIALSNEDAGTYDACREITEAIIEEFGSI